MGPLVLVALVSFPCLLPPSWVAAATAVAADGHGEEGASCRANGGSDGCSAAAPAEEPPPPCCGEELRGTPPRLKGCANDLAPLPPPPGDEGAGVAPTPFGLLISHATSDMDYTAFAAVSNAMWCRRHGHAFVLDETDEGKGWSNPKVPIIRHWLQAAQAVGARWVVWVDGDVALLNQDGDRDYLRGIIELHATDETDILVSEDVMMGKVSLRFNTGTVIVRCSPWADRFLERWADLVDSEELIDQMALERLHRADAMGVRQKLVGLAPVVFNSLSANIMMGPTANEQPLIHLMGVSGDIRRLMFETTWSLACQGDVPTNFTLLQTLYESELSKQAGSFSSKMNLAQHLHANGRHNEALRSYRKILKDQVASANERHPNTLDVVNNFAILLMDMEKNAETERLFRWALDGQMANGGTGNPKALSTANSFGEFLTRLKRLGEAEPLFRMALKARKRILGDDHPETAKSENNLVQNLLMRGRAREAQKLKLSSLDAAHTLVGSLLQQGDVEAGLSVLQRAVASQRGGLSQTGATAKYNVAHLLSRLERHGEAEAWLRGALRDQGHLFPPGHEDTLATMQALAAALQARGGKGRAAEAKQLLRKATAGEAAE